MSARDDMPGLAAQERQCQQAITLLEHAIDTAKNDPGDELWHERAMRLKGSATIMLAGVAEILITVGMLQGAAACAHAGLLEDDDG